MLLITGTEIEQTVNFCFFDNEPPYAKIQHILVEKYADFYEGGSHLLEDPRLLMDSREIDKLRKNKETPLKDFELLILFHSEVTHWSTVPFSAIKLEYI